MPRTMFPRKIPQEEAKDDPQFYYEAELLPMQRIALLDLVRERLGDKCSPANSAFFRGIETELLGCRRVNTPLIRERLNWAELEVEARRQGVGVVDVLWDRMASKDPG